MTVSVDNGKEEAQNGPKVTPGGPVGPKDQLDYMVKVLGLTAVYQEFPKKQHADSDTEENTEAKVEDEVFTLLSISTDPPQVSEAKGSLYGWSVYAYKCKCLIQSPSEARGLGNENGHLRSDSVSR